jgi:hypothetical protein
MSISLTPPWSTTEDIGRFWREPLYLHEPYDL